MINRIRMLKKRIIQPHEPYVDKLKKIIRSDIVKYFSILSNIAHMIILWPCANQEGWGVKLYSPKPVLTPSKPIHHQKKIPCVAVYFYPPPPNMQNKLYISLFKISGVHFLGCFLGVKRLNCSTIVMKSTI